MVLGVARRSESCGWELAVCALFATNRENGISKLQFDLEARNLRHFCCAYLFLDSAILELGRKRNHPKCILG